MSSKAYLEALMSPLPKQEKPALSAQVVIPKKEEKCCSKETLDRLTEEGAYCPWG